MTISMKLIQRHLDRFDTEFPQDFIDWLMARYSFEPHENCFDEILIFLWEAIRNACHKFLDGKLDISTSPYAILKLQFSDMQEAISDLRDDLYDLQLSNDELRRKLGHKPEHGFYH